MASGSGIGTGEGSHGSSEDISLLIVLELVICVIGVIANVVVILVILILRDYRKALTHWYVLQLAIADCAFLLTIPFIYSEYQNGGWIYSNGMCKAKQTILFLNYHASILFLVVMSVDRYIAVCHAHSDLQTVLRNRRGSIIITVIVWTLSLLFCIPIMQYSTTIASNGKCACGYFFPQEFHNFCSKHHPEMPVDSCADYFHNMTQQLIHVCVSGQDPAILLMEYDENSEDSNGQMFNASVMYDEGSSDYVDVAPDAPATCNDDHQGSGWFVYMRFLFIGMFLFPLLIMMYCYVCIIRQLRKTRKTIRKTGMSNTRGRKPSTSKRRRMSASSEKANKKIQRVNVTCVLLVVTFIVCWLPFHIYHFVRSYGYSSIEFCDKMLVVVSVLLFANSALNPLIYNFIGTNFRTRLKNAAVTMKSSIRRSSASSIRGTLVRYDKKENGSRNSSHAITMTTKENKSLSSSHGFGNASNWSMVAMPGSIADALESNTKEV